MSVITDTTLTTINVLDDLRRLGTLPAWLCAIDDPDLVGAALTRAVPELASGALTLLECKSKRLRMKKDRWTAMYHLTVGAGDGTARTIQLRGTVIPPGRPQPGQMPSAAFGSEGWQIYLPELRLQLETQPPDVALPALPLLTDPEQARALLERSISSGSPAYRNLRIAACEPKIMRYKPGSRCTILYRLQYAPEHAAQGWPDIVVAKTYHGDKGRIAYEGMRALWDSALASGDSVTIAEPLAFIPEVNVLVQGPIREEQTLQDLLRSAMQAGTPQALEELNSYMCQAAAGLAALHGSNATIGEPRGWHDELAEVREDLVRLAAAIPSLADVAAPLLARLEAHDAQNPSDTPVATHGTFRPAQVLIHQRRIGFIDFDGACQAEPALDLALFLGKARSIAMSACDELAKHESQDHAARSAQLARIEAICETFLAEYERHAPVSRPRIALWQALNLLTLVLHCWTKVKPDELNDGIGLLTHHLHAMGIE